MTAPAAQTGSAARPVALFVLGMGRSGTSALTRVLSLCGARLPAGMMGADNGNQRGYWEPRAALLLNRAILERHGSAWWDPSLRLLEQDAIGADEKAACMTEIGAFLNRLPPRRSWSSRTYKLLRCPTCGSTRHVWPDSTSRP